MKTHFFNTKPYDRESFLRANTKGSHQLIFHDVAINAQTAVLAQGANAVCVFVNDQLNAETISALARQNVNVIALRCAGFNNVDLKAAAQHELIVVRVPAYSPYAVAEHTLGLILCLNRKIHRAFNRVREGNFSLAGFIGFDLHGKTVGIIGTGRIGTVMATICKGLGCQVLAHDPSPNSTLVQQKIIYTDIETLCRAADVVTLHCPLTPTTRHLIGVKSLSYMRPHTMLVNTSRGALVDTKAVIDALKQNRIGGLAIDVYEEEAGLFFEDHSQAIISDDIFMRLTTFPNVLITGHQAFLTHEALDAIATTTLINIEKVLSRQPCENIVSA